MSPILSSMTKKMVAQMMDPSSDRENGGARQRQNLKIIKFSLFSMSSIPSSMTKKMVAQMMEPGRDRTWK